MFTGLLPLFVLAHFGHHLLTALLVPLLPMIRHEFSFDYTQSGVVLSVFNLAYGIGQLPAGWLADRIGRRIMITVGIVGVAFCGLFVGLSSTYIMLVIFLALMGLLGGGYHPAASPVVASTVEPENRGSALGFHVIGGSASHFLAPLLGVAIAVALGWRGPYIVLAVPAFIFGIVFYIMMGRLPALSQVTQKNADYEQRRFAEHQGRIRRLIAFMVLSAVTQSMVTSAISFVPLFMVDYLNMSKEAGGAIISIYYSAGLWASALGGYLSDRFGKVRMMLVTCFVLGMLTYFLNMMSSSFGVGATLLFVGMFAFMRMPIAESYIINNTSEKHRSTILGIYFFGSMEGSALLTPLFGYIIDHQGFSFGYTVIAVSVVLTVVICSFFLRGGRD